MRASGILALLFVVTLAAGCAGGNAATVSSTPPPTSAAVPEPDDATGSVTGTVQDDERIPIAGARVGLVETSLTTQTDAAGAFTFNDLEPRTYTVIVEKLGYESGARRIDVAAGEVQSANFTLKPIITTAEAHHLAIPKVAQIHLDNVWLSFYVRLYVNNSDYNNLRCYPCEFSLHFEKKAVQVISEAMWPTNPTPAVNKEITVYYNRDATPTSWGTIVLSSYMTNRQAITWTEAQTTIVEKLDKLRLYIYGAGFTGISHQQKVDSWTTFAYGEEMPDDYSALPPAS